MFGSSFCWSFLENLSRPRHNSKAWVDGLSLKGFLLIIISFCNVVLFSGVLEKTLAFCGSWKKLFLTWLSDSLLVCFVFELIRS